MKHLNCILLLFLLLLFPSCSDNSSDGGILTDGDADTTEQEQEDIEAESTDGDGIPGDGDTGDGDVVDEDGDSDLAESDLESPEAEKEIVVYNWPRCDRINNEITLKAKALEFDRVSREQHIAEDDLFRNLYLSEDLAEIERYLHTENTILWSGIYMASQALRYAVTGESEAQQNAIRVAAGLHELTNVTGSSGLYGRTMSKPGVSYNPVAADHPGWTDSPAEGYDGWRFRNDVSKDGYAGMMLGYALALEHFDDEQLLSDIRDRLREVIDHLISNGLQLIDTNGEVTEHGRLFHSAMDDYPGFNAMLTSSWVKIAEQALGDQNLDDFYYGCLMQMREGVECPEIEVEAMGLGTYIESMENLLYLFIPNCKENIDNFDMCYQAIYPLVRLEKDKELKGRLLDVVRNGMFHIDDPKYQDIAKVGNSWFTFTYAALTGDDPDEDPILKAAVEDAICMMKDFPAKKIQRYIPKGEQEVVCDSRLANPRAAEAIPLAEYHFDNYLWRLDFFEIVVKEVPEDKRLIYSPEDYLLAYWLARYHGIIGADM